MKQEIVEVCAQLYRRSLIVASDGNVSVRLGDTVLITTSGAHKGFLKPEQIAEVSIEGAVLSGNPSSELAMHLAIYERCPEARAVVHTHAPVATAWGVARQDLGELPVESLTESVLALGRVPFVPYAKPGTAKMGEALLAFLPDCKALILRHHGCVCWDSSLERAFFLTEHLEHTASTLMNAEALGGCHSLSQEALEALR